MQIRRFPALGLLLVGAMATTGVRAQSSASTSVQAASAPAASAIGFETVAKALAALQARDGNGTIVTHADEWVIVAEPPAKAQWSFTPPSHAAYPAVVRRVIRRGADGSTSVETSSLCEAPEAACMQLLAEFQAMNARITQAVKARGRQGSQLQMPRP